MKVTIYNTLNTESDRVFGGESIVHGMTSVLSLILDPHFGTGQHSIVVREDGPWREACSLPRPIVRRHGANQSQSSNSYSTFRQILLKTQKEKRTHYPKATHSNLTSEPAVGDSGNDFGKLFGNFNVW
jgi:hypothetical protein